MTITALITRFKALDIEKIGADSVDQTKEAIADLNAEQLFKGLRSDGSNIMPGYSPLTIEIKKSKGQPTDRVTLRDKGNFYAGITTDVQGLKVITGSSDSKAAKLEKKYSTKRASLYRLFDKFKREYLNESLRPAFKLKLEALTGLHFG